MVLIKEHNHDADKKSIIMLLIKNITKMLIKSITKMLIKSITKMLLKIEHCYDVDKRA